MEKAWDVSDLRRSRSSRNCVRWMGDGSCVRLRPQHRGHVRSYDFVEDRTHNGRKFRMLNIIDEFSRECLAMVPLRRFRSNDVIDVLADLFIEHGPPQHIRSDDGPEFVAHAVQGWLARLGWASQPSMSSREARGRTAISKASTLACRTSCSTARSSTASRKSVASQAGGATTTIGLGHTAVWATARQHQKRR